MPTLKHIGLIILLIPAFLGCNNASTPGTPVSQVTKIEFKLASEKPAANLVEMPVFKSNEIRYVEETPSITNQDIAFLSIAPDGNGRKAIMMTFTDQGAQKMNQLTSKNTGANLALVVDDVLVFAPRINSAISDKAMITDDFSDEEITALHDKMTFTEMP
ncbi:MAG: SecDF P1 head subdomain-containing protein [Pirellulales bacterium]